MPSTPHRVPKYRLHKPSGQAVVTLGGRDFYLGKHNTPESHELYRRRVAEWLNTGVHPSHDAGNDIAVIEVVVAYCKFAKQYYRKDGKPTREYEMIVESCRFVTPVYGRTSALSG